MENKYEKNMEALLQKAFLEQDLTTLKNEALLNASAGATLKKGFSFGQVFLNSWIGIMTLLGVLIISIVGISGSFKGESKYSPRSFTYKLPEAVAIKEMIELPTQSVKLLEQDVVFAKIKRGETDIYSKSVDNNWIKVFTPEQSFYRIVEMSDGEKTKHLKEKKQFIKEVLKSNKTILIPRGGNNNSTPFYIWQTELSNKDYSIFLNDLRYLKRSSDYNKAAIQNEKWVTTFDKSYNEPLKEMYHLHTAYNDYPVVNISSDAANLFCEWLTQEIANQSKNKFEFDGVRLPTNEQWMFAASGGNKFFPFPWGGPHVRTSDGKYLANYKPLKNNYVADGGLTTVKIFSYKPNQFGLFNMAGNVAEMVVKENQTGHKGGSWADVREKLEINNPIQNLGKVQAHPTVGFRPTISIVNRSDNRTRVYTPEKKWIDEKKLTEESKINHLKVKAKYLKAIIKFDKKKVSKINTNAQDVPSGEKPLSSFMMWTTEISNSEYQLFLTDLVFQNKKEEYAIAVVDSLAWTRKYNIPFFEPMRNMYGWHPAYDDYPVVNVSIEGARLFCKWLAKEITGTYQGKEILDVRLPNERQWEYAASSGQKFRPYPWGGPFIKNDNGCYLANYKPGVDTASSCLHREKSMDDVILNDDFKNNAFVADGGLITVKVNSYNPNGFGLYNTSGNVSEMVVNARSGKVGIKGGSWEDSSEELKIKTPLRKEGKINADPGIGFRPVIFYKEKSESGRAYREVIQNPSLSEQQIRENNKRKDKMIQQILTVNHDYYTDLLGGSFTLNEQPTYIKKVRVTHLNRIDFIKCSWFMSNTAFNNLI